MVCLLVFVVAVVVVVVGGGGGGGGGCGGGGGVLFCFGHCGKKQYRFKPQAKFSFVHCFR